jgi:hypothetical protein
MTYGARTGIGELLVNVLFSKPGMLVMFGCAAYLGYTNREIITRAEQGITRREVPIAPGYFTDPAGLAVDIPINGDGKQEVYLVHEPSGRRIAIREDLLPDTQSLLEGIARRADTATPGDAKAQLRLLTDCQRKLVERLYEPKR